MKGHIRLACTLSLFAEIALGIERPRAADSPDASSPSVSPSASRLVKGWIPRALQTGEAHVFQPIDPKSTIRLTIALHSAKRAELKKALDDILDPKSPNYRHFLTFDQWKSSYAPSDQDVQAVADWTAAAGLREVHRFAANQLIVVEGSVGAVQQALEVNINEYELGDRHFFGNDRPPTVPAEISDRIENIFFGLSSFVRPRSPHESLPLPEIRTPRVPDGPFIQSSELRADGPNPSPPGGGQHPRLPDDLRNQITGPLGGSALEPPDLWSSEAYNTDALAKLSHCCNPTHASGGSPKETSIAIVGAGLPNPSDLTQFFNTYGLAYAISLISVDGASCCAVEPTLDAEWSTAMSNSFGSSKDTAHVYMYQGNGPLTDLLDAWEAALSDDKARILSTSTGQAEDNYGGGFSSAFGTTNPTIDQFTDITWSMASLGWTIAAAAGDDGAYADCSSLSVQYPASDPIAVAVGGTTLSLKALGATGLKFKKETAWNGNGGGGGGGCSATLSAPSWQLAGICANGMRSVPDVSLNAGSAQDAYVAGGWGKYGGTSLGAPELAGFFAQVNSYLAYINLSGLGCQIDVSVCNLVGQPGWALESAYARLAPQVPFYDIASGCNGPNPNVGYCAGRGYDQATGYGSPNMLQLAWAIIDWNANWGFVAQPQPTITFQGPAINAWYANDQEVSFDIHGGRAGIAGYTAKWDHDPGDPFSEPNPGSGNPFWDGPAVVGASKGSMHLSAAGKGCHTAYVRAWANTGQGSDAGKYGPICFGAPPGCTISYPCPETAYQPPDYEIQCTGKASFLQQTPYDPTSPVTYLGEGDEYSGVTSPYAYGDNVLACDPGTSANAGPLALSNCLSFSIFKPTNNFCAPPPANTGPKTPTKWPYCCTGCMQTGGYCTVTANGECGVCK